MNKQEYESILKAFQKELDALNEVVIDDEFPRLNEPYFFINQDYIVCRDLWTGHPLDDDRRDFIGIYRTKEECERACEIKRAFKVKSNEFKADWNNFSQHKYCLCYDYGSNKLLIFYSYFIQKEMDYFKSEQVIKDLIAKFGEADIVKYYLSIERVV